MPDDEDSEFDQEQDEMWYETQAREAIESAGANPVFDEIRSVVYLDSGEDHRFNTVQEGFSDVESLRSRLTEIGENEWIAHVPFDSGSPVWRPSVDGYVEDVIARHGIEEFFEQVAPPDEASELVIARHLVLPRAGITVELDAKQINDELISYLARHPEQMRNLNPRKFEELVAELFRMKGYDVELTPATRDGGFDMRVFRKSEVGTILTLVECKRYAPHNNVGVEIVRGLYGVVEMEGATTGLIATTSYFTSDAKSFQSKKPYRLHLADFNALTDWLKNHKKPV